MIYKQIEVEFIGEEYETLVKSPINKKTYTVFVNPTSKEVRELASDEPLARFIAYDGKLYVFNASLLHATAISKLELPISSTPNINDAFLGIAKAATSGSLQYYDSNQVSEKHLENAVRKYPYILKFFQ
jgi:hypothetical protein